MEDALQAIFENEEKKMVSFTPVSKGSAATLTSTITDFVVNVFSDVSIPTIPTSYNFVFNIENTSNSPIQYDFSTILNSSGPASIGIGTIPSGMTAQVAFCSNTSTLQYGSVSVVIVGDQPVDMRFWSGYSGINQLQYINILAENGFSITEDTSIQNNASGNGYTIGVGGHGGELRTDNIWIMVS